jgi:hypothetical protein
LKSSQWPRSTQIKLPPGNPARFTRPYNTESASGFLSLPFLSESGFSRLASDISMTSTSSATFRMHYAGAVSTTKIGPHLPLVTPRRRKGSAAAHSPGQTDHKETAPSSSYQMTLTTRSSPRIIQDGNTLRQRNSP